MSKIALAELVDLIGHSAVLGHSQGGPFCWIAADLIAQAEHDKLSQSILICNDKKKIEDIRNCVKQQVLTLPKKNIINSNF